MSYAYKIDFEPVAKVDEAVLLLPERKAFKVTFVEPLALIPKDFGAVTAAPDTNVLVDQKVEELVMPKNELAQLRFAPMDDVYIKILQPKAAGRFLTKEYQVMIGLEIWTLNPTLSRSEIFQFGDKGLLFTITNATAYDQPRTLVLFQGFRLQLEPLPEIPEKWTGVPIGAKAE